jgi:hypothetical protein
MNFKFSLIILCIFSSQIFFFGKVSDLKRMGKLFWPASLMLVDKNPFVQTGEQIFDSLPSEKLKVLKDQKKTKRAVSYGKKLLYNMILGQTAKKAWNKTNKMTKLFFLSYLFASGDWKILKNRFNVDFQKYHRKNKKLFETIKQTEEYLNYASYVRAYFEKRKNKDGQQVKGVFGSKFESYFDERTKDDLKGNGGMKNDFFNLIINGLNNIEGAEIKSLNGIKLNEHIKDSLLKIVFDNEEKCKFITYLIFNYYIFKIFNIFDKNEISEEENKKKISRKEIEYYKAYCDSAFRLDGDFVVSDIKKFFGNEKKKYEELLKIKDDNFEKTVINIVENPNFFLNSIFFKVALAGAAGYGIGYGAKKLANDYLPSWFSNDNSHKKVEGQKKLDDSLGEELPSESDKKLFNYEWTKNEQVRDEVGLLSKDNYNSINVVNFRSLKKAIGALSIEKKKLLSKYFSENDIEVIETILSDYNVISNNPNNREETSLYQILHRKGMHERFFEKVKILEVAKKINYLIDEMIKFNEKYLKYSSEVEFINSKRGKDEPLAEKLIYDVFDMYSRMLLNTKYENDLPIWNLNLIRGSKVGKNILSKIVQNLVLDFEAKGFEGAEVDMIKEKIESSILNSAQSVIKSDDEDYIKLKLLIKRNPSIIAKFSRQIYVIVNDIYDYSKKMFKLSLEMSDILSFPDVKEVYF